jgi:hypothetical protein
MSSPDRAARVERVALAEVESRDVNETIAPAPEAGWDLGVVPRQCECGDHDCAVTIRMTVAEYEELRGHPRRFAIADGHLYAEAEVVVARERRYVVVEKFEVAAAIAEATDPRA